MMLRWRCVGRSVLQEYKRNSLLTYCKLRTLKSLQPLYLIHKKFYCQNQTRASDAFNVSWNYRDTESLLENCRKIDKSYYTISSSEMLQRLQILSDLGFSHSEIEKLIMKAPYIMRGKNFEDVTHILKDHGFNSKTIYHVFKSYSRLTDQDPSELSNTITFLRSVLQTERRLYESVASNPGILSMSKYGINSRIKMLRELFKTKDAADLIKKSPNVLFEDWEIVKEKFDYVFSSMGVSQRQMMHSDMFTYSLLHIKIRHIFLLRAGLFRKIRREKGEIDNNPRLEDILGLSNKAFVKKFGGMTELDYKAFSGYLQKELEEELSDDEEVEESDNK